jgi:FAD/FMN-containing dehydrogenase
MEIDKTSLLVTVDSDQTISELEKELNREDFTLNYLPVPTSNILLADVLNERLPNLYGDVYGGIEDLCVQVRLAQPDGSVWENVLAPRSATGPNLKKIAIGGGESFGIIVQATLRVFFQPESKAMALVRFSHKRQEEFFLRTLRKNQTPVPLWASLPREDVDPFFENLKKSDRVLGISWWGEKGEVQDQHRYLQTLAVQKGGEWYELEEEKGQREWLVDLQRYAMQRIQTLVEQNEGLSLGHRNLIRKVQSIL